MRSGITLWLALLLTLLSTVPAAASEDVPPPVTKWISVPVPPGYPIYHYQEFGYRITAEAGPLRLGLIHYEAVPTPLFDVTLVQGEELLDYASLTSTESTVEFTLPAAGEYDVWVRPLFESGESYYQPKLSLSAPGLRMSGTDMGYVDVIDLPEYYHVAAPMDLTVRPASSYDYINRISVNGAVIFEAERPDSRPVQLHLDPADLDDGLYWLEMEARTTRDRHRSYTYRSFLIDREAQYTDLPHWHWARQPVEIMSHLAILNGLGDGTFAPEAPVLRKEFAKMIALTFDLTGSGSGESPFADAPGDWSQPYIDALYEAGLILGEIGPDGQRYFRPDRSITRAEATAIIGRALGIGAADISDYPPLFHDDDQIPAWALPSVAVLYVARWISGFPDGTFSPGEQLSRAQAAKILAHALGLSPATHDAGGQRPPGAPSGWMLGRGGPERRAWNPGFAGAADLAPLWVAPVYPTWSYSAVLGNGLLYASGQRGRVYALLPETGQILWQSVVAGPGWRPGSLAYSAAQNLVYVTVDDTAAGVGKVVALHPTTGKTVWESTTEGQWSVSDQSPVVAGDLLLVTGKGFGTTLYAFDAATGALRWRRLTSGSSPPAVSGDRIFVADGNAQIFAYRLSDGEPLWERRSGWSGYRPAPVVGHGLLFTLEDDGNILALDEATGTEVWRQPVVRVYSSAWQPAVDDRYLWAPLSGSGTGLAVLEAATGAPVATLDVCNRSLVVGATHAYGACDGQIYSIDRSSFAVAPVAPGEWIMALDGDRLYYLADDPSPWERWLLGALGSGATAPGPAGLSARPVGSGAPGAVRAPRSAIVQP